MWEVPSLAQTTINCTHTSLGALRPIELAMLKERNEQPPLQGQSINRL
jgi:hypothetical protein